MSAAEESWYIVKNSSHQCEILSAQDLESLERQAPSTQMSVEKWGPFKVTNQAIAKRVGLIRAGKCQPS